MHICTAEEITPRVYDNGYLHVCMPIEKVKIYNNFEYYPQISAGFHVKPNYEIIKDNKTVNAEINNFALSRLHVNSELDLSDKTGNPIRKTVKYIGRLQFELGYI